MEKRLSEYPNLKIEKNNTVECPVCHKSFVNKYSLSNHFLIRGFEEGSKYLDDAHKKYYLKKQEQDHKNHLEEVKNRIYRKICIRP